MTRPETESDDSVGIIFAELQGVLEAVDRMSIEHTVRLVVRAERVFTVGEGRSGLMAKAFAMRLMHLGSTSYVVGETCTPPITAGDLLVAVSGSGATESVVHTAAAARDHGALVLTVTSTESSPLAQLAHHVLHIPGATKHRRAGEPLSVQPLSSLFDQALHVTLDAVALDLAQRRDIDNSRARRAHANTE